MTDNLVLVTGASGYLGAHVVKVLQESGYRVRGTVRTLKNEKKVDFLYKLCPGAKYRVELVEADLLDAESWPRAVSGCNYVMHTASPFPMTNPKLEDDVLKPALDGTIHVLRAVADDGTVKRVVLTSSFVAMEGRETQEGKYTEEDWSVPSRQTMVYNRSKTLAEKAAWDFLRELLIFIRLLEHKMPMVPQFYFPMVDVRDVAEAHVKCLTTDGAGNRHLLFTENAFFPDVAKWLEKEFKPKGYCVPTRVLPNPIVAVMSWFNKEMKTAKEFASVPKDISNDRLRHVLGITPIPIERSVVDMAYSLIEVGLVRKTEKYTGRAGTLV